MNVLHMANSLELSEGGTTEALVQLSDAALQAGHQVTVWCAATRGPDARQRLEARGVTVVSFATALGNWHLSPRMLVEAVRGVHAFDVVHAHGLWQGATLAALVASWPMIGRGVRPRLVISPHGQLDDWSFAHRTWKKRPYFSAVRGLLATTSVRWHGTCKNEATAISQRAKAGLVHVVPLSVGATTRSHQPRPGSRLRVLFLGRLHPVKHVDVVVDACAKLRDADGLEELWLVGAGSAGYTSELCAQVASNRLRDVTQFCGSLFGAEKEDRLARADVLVLPSAVENFGLVAAEAAAAGLPVIVSDQVGIAGEVRRYGAGLVILPGDTAALVDALRRMQDHHLRAQMSVAGVKLAAEQYTQARVAQALDRLYQPGP